MNPILQITGENMQNNGEQAQSPENLPVKKSFASECRSMLGRSGPRSFDSDSRSTLSASGLQHKESKGSLRTVFTKRNKTPEEVNRRPTFTSPFSTSLSQITLPISDNHNDSQSALAVPMERKGSDISARTTGGFQLLGRRTRFSMQPRPAKSFENDAATRTANASKFAKPVPSSEFPILSQAYADSVKHAQLEASSLPADTIIRLNNRAKAAASTTTLKKSEIAKIKRRSYIEPGSLSNAEWTEKIYVLVTGGYLFQYNTDGPVDRLPEKVLQLSKRSVAFVSDAIPGKHWVLQISQAMDDGTMVVDSRSLLSRLSFKNSEYRRLTSNMLLVFQSVDEMESWLTVFRQAIEALGGKKHAAETAPSPIEPEGETELEGEIEPVPEVHVITSIVSEDPPQCPEPISPTSRSALASWNTVTENELDRAQKLIIDLAQPSNGRVRQSMDTTLSHDAPSEGSRDDTRLSYVTTNTSVNSHPSSPTHESNEPEIQKRAESLDSSRPEPRKPREHRLSMQITPRIVLDTPEVKVVVPHSVSAPDLNFYPSPSKRSSLLPQTQMVTFPEPSTTARLMMPSRKPPPVLAQARPLSPVQDEPYPKKQEALQLKTSSPKVPSKVHDLPQRPRTSSGSNRSHRSLLAQIDSGRRTPDSFQGIKHQPSLRELRHEILAEDDTPKANKASLPPPTSLPGLLLPPSPRSSVEYTISPLTGTPPTTAPPDMPLPTPPTSSCSRRTSKRLSGMPNPSNSNKIPSRASSPIPPRSSSRQSLRASMAPSPTPGNGRTSRSSMQNPVTAAVMGPPPAPPPTKNLPELPRCASAASLRSVTPDLRSATPDLGPRCMTPEARKRASRMSPTLSDRKVERLVINTAYKGKGPPSPMERRKLKRDMKAIA